MPLVTHFSLFFFHFVDEKVLSPVTCVRVSILDFGHPLSGGSSMGQGGSTKALLCFAIIHLGEERGRRGKGRKKEKKHVYNEVKKNFSSIVIQTTLLPCLFGITVQAILYC